MRILAMSGAPGSGKSTLMQEIIQPFNRGTRRKRGLLEYMDMNEILVLGYYEQGEIFGGCDRLSMSCQQDAIEFLKVVLLEHPNANAILFEGDRLTNSNFLKLCREVGDLRFVSLKVSEEELLRRRQARSAEVGKEQNEVWLKGRESKSAKLAADFFSETRTVNTMEQSQKLASELRDWVLFKTEKPKTVGSLF